MFPPGPFLQIKLALRFIKLGFGLFATGASPVHYQHSDHIYKAEVLRMLYAIFLLDLQNVQDRTIVHRQLSQRVEDIFNEFIRLLPDNFIEHHDIPFYASRLCISPVYLSRVVRQDHRYVEWHQLYMLLFLLLKSCYVIILAVHRTICFNDNFPSSESQDFFNKYLVSLVLLKLGAIFRKTKKPALNLSRF